VLHAKGKEEFIEILERLQEDQIDAAVEQGAHLCAKTLLPVDAPAGGVFSGNAQGTNAASDKCPLRRLPGELRGLPVDLIDTVCKPMTGEARQVGEKAMQYAMWGERDGSVAMRRVGNYAVDYDLVPLTDVAGKTKVMDDAFIAASGTDVTEAFRDYLHPLLGTAMPEAKRLRAAPVAKVLRPAA
jgi:hypothetical protein